MKINVPDFANARVLVVGDVMLDKYWHGHSRRISPEAPVPVVHVRDAELRAGGASNVALNITALGGQALLLGMTGDDDNADALQALLTEQAVECHFLREPGYETSLKLRIVAQQQQMIRLDFEDDFSAVDKSALLRRYQELLAAVDVVVLSDYAKGTLSEVEVLIATARSAGKAVIIDPKGADFNKYQGATLITPNYGEFEAVVGKCATEAEIIEKATDLLAQLALDALLVTRGENGMSLIRQAAEPLHLPTYAREVFDVTGAGDTVIGTLAAALAAGANRQNAVALANLAAGLVVRKLGTATTSLAEIQHALHEQNPIDSGIISEDELEQVIRVARAKGERVIMTNGCFDLLHTGHITYLEKARALGDRLVIAVNDDASVRALKGETRPINRLEDRMQVLAALGCVDWVIPFREETPERLYCKVLPDVIVKGGDYQRHEVIGGDCVEANGGAVALIPFVDGQSTTDMVNRIKGAADA